MSQCSQGTCHGDPIKTNDGCVGGNVNFWGRKETPPPAAGLELGLGVLNGWDMASGAWGGLHGLAMYKMMAGHTIKERGQWLGYAWHAAT